jgi:hypothetical protein
MDLQKIGLKMRQNAEDMPCLIQSVNAHIHQPTKKD